MPFFCFGGVTNGLPRGKTQVGTRLVDPSLQFIEIRLTIPANPWGSGKTRGKMRQQKTCGNEAQAEICGNGDDVNDMQ